MPAGGAQTGIPISTTTASGRAASSSLISGSDSRAPRTASTRGLPAAAAMMASATAPSPAAPASAASAPSTADGSIRSTSAHAAKPQLNRPAATFSSGSTSTTSGSASAVRAGPDRRSARRAATSPMPSASPPGLARLAWLAWVEACALFLIAGGCARRASASQARSLATRLAASSSRAPASWPDATASASAARTALYISSSVSRPRQTRSMPAATASTAAVGIPCTALAAFISSASLTTTPPKPSSSRSRPVTAAGENVAGRSPVSPRTRRCPGMMAKDPAAMAATNGGRSRTRSSAIVPETVASVRCESAAVLPCPGKCLAHAATPAP